METVQRLFGLSNCNYSTEKECYDFSKHCYKFLGSPENVHELDCDAMYYDFSVLPNDVKGIMGDAYLVFGITDQGKFLSKWVDRYEFDK